MVSEELNFEPTYTLIKFTQEASAFNSSNFITTIQKHKHNLTVDIH